MLPVLAIIGGIDFKNEITIGELIAIALTCTGAIVFLVMAIWKCTTADRTFSLWFLDEEVNTADFPPAHANARRWRSKAIIKSSNGLLRLRVKAHAGVLVRDLDVRFVQRRKCLRLLPWRWASAQEQIEVTDGLLDAYANRLSVSGEPRATVRPDTVGGQRLIYTPTPQWISGGGSLWLEVPLKTKVSCWKGHLEFQGPSPAGNRAYKRRSVEINLAPPGPDTPDVQL